MYPEIDFILLASSDAKAEKVIKRIMTIVVHDIQTKFLSINKDIGEG